jgi:hypothetical protein
MLANRRTFRTAWLALCVTLFATFVPSLTALLDPREGRAGWIEVCTAQGLSRWIAPAADGEEHPQSTTAGHAQCPICSLHAAAPPPGPASVPDTTAGWTGDAPRPETSEPAAPARWSIAAPRAPPSRQA